MTPAERKKVEEGDTSITDACEWGYYDDAESVDKLLDWLDSRGNRESKLRKELLSQRDIIVKYMKHRQEYLAETSETAESEDAGSKRVSTRQKTYVGDPKHRCLAWHNTTSLSDNGHLHVDASRPTKRAKRTTDEPKDVKATSRRGKPLTRQGTRYNF